MAYPSEAYTDAYAGFDPEDVDLLVRRRRRRNILLIGGLSTSGLLAIGIYLVLPAGSVYQEYSQAVLLFGITCLSLAIAVAAMVYLQTGFDARAEWQSAIRHLRNVAAMEELTAAGSSIALETGESTRHLREELEELRREIFRIRSGGGLSLDEREQLVASIAESVQADAADAILSDLTRRVSDQAIEDSKRHVLLAVVGDNAQRLLQEISALTRRGNLNLMLGGVTTLSGLVLLGFFVLFDRNIPDEAIDYGMHFLPRITLVVFVQAFAYFFLRLYKTSLEEIKFFQNELTNVQQRQLALFASLNFSDAASLQHVIRTMAETDRNHPLQSGQTTVELEREKSQTQTLADLAKHLATLIPGRGSSS